MRRPPLGALVVCAAVALSTAQARADLTLYTGTDQGANSNDPRPNSNAAAASFAAAAGALGVTNTITFESAPVGSFTNLTVAPGVSMNGSDALGDAQTIRNSPLGSPDSLYGYNTTAGGSHFVSLFGGTLTFSFSTAIQAFGGYISGVQLDGETITFSDGTSQTVAIPNAGSGISYVGFTDAGKSISSVTINATNDIIGVDDVSYTTAQTAVVPEPSTMAIGGLGGCAFLLYALRNRKRIAS